MVQGLDNPIFVFHLLPYGIFDIVLNENSLCYLENVGSKKLLQFFIKYRPRLLITAHLHEHYGLDYATFGKVLAQGFGNLTLLGIDIEIIPTCREIIKKMEFIIIYVMKVTVAD